MYLCVCLDQKNGMMFNSRRQSRDRVVIEDLINLSQGKLIMNTYSSSLFKDRESCIKITEEPLDITQDNEVCFIENIKVAPAIDKIDKIIVYRWDKSYPADQYFDCDLNQWELQSAVELTGYSHDKITKEIYGRRK